MTPNNCRHTDVREFDGLRCCLACGETQFRQPSIQDQVPVQETEYMYTDLRCLEQGQTIRLVVLAPGHNAEPLHCTIVLSSLQYSDYEAISYTWATENGDATKSQPVHIDGSTLYVTRNCEAALRRLRHAESHRRLWIDAMCINQSNVSERNNQVGLMDQIYRNASRVHICICHPERDYSDCMRWLEKDDYLSRVQTQIEALFHCRYFGRVWVLQEILLASTLVLHVNGDEVVISDDSRSLLRQACLKWNIDVPGPLKSLLQKVPPKSVMQQLAISMTLACSDARDRVYAVLSLLEPDIRNLIPINYSLSMEGVFADAVVACIADTGRLDILYYVFPTQGTETWVQAQSLNAERFTQFLQFGTRYGKPNQASTSEIYIPQRRWFEFSSDLKWVPYVYLKSTSRELQHVSDTYLKFGKSSPVERLPHPLSSSHIFPCLRVRAHFVDMLVDSDKLELQAFAQDFKALPRDLFLVKYVSILGGFSSLYDTSNDWELRRFEDHLTVCLDQILKDTTSSIKSANVFRTSRDIGFSTAPFTSGDHVYIIDGVDGTFILREVGHNKFRILGICYLFTAMPFSSTVLQVCYMDPWGKHSSASASGDYCYICGEFVKDYETAEIRMIEIY